MTNYPNTSSAEAEKNLLAEQTRIQLLFIPCYLGRVFYGLHPKLSLTGTDRDFLRGVIQQAGSRKFFRMVTEGGNQLVGHSGSKPELVGRSARSLNPHAPYEAQDFNSYAGIPLSAVIT